MYYDNNLLGELSLLVYIKYLFKFCSRFYLQKPQLSLFFANKSLKFFLRNKNANFDLNFLLMLLPTK